jgi:hypothetical protein
MNRMIWIVYLEEKGVSRENIMKYVYILDDFNMEL